MGGRFRPRLVDTVLGWVNSHQNRRSSPKAGRNHARLGQPRPNMVETASELVESAPNRAHSPNVGQHHPNPQMPGQTSTDPQELSSMVQPTPDKLCRRNPEARGCTPTGNVPTAAATEFGRLPHHPRPTRHWKTKHAPQHTHTHTGRLRRDSRNIPLCFSVGSWIPSEPPGPHTPHRLTREHIPTPTTH